MVDEADLATERNLDREKVGTQSPKYFASVTWRRGDMAEPESTTLDGLMTLREIMQFLEDNKGIDTTDGDDPWAIAYLDAKSDVKSTGWPELRQLAADRLEQDRMLFR